VATPEITLGVTLAVLGAGFLHALWNALLKSSAGDPVLDTALIIAGSSVVALVVLRRRIGNVPDSDAIRATVRAGTAALALAVVAAPIAGAIGRSSPASALLATAVAGAAGLVVYGAGLMLLRAEELTSLVGLVRRRNAAPPDD